MSVEFGPDNDGNVIIEIPRDHVSMIYEIIGKLQKVMLINGSISLQETVLYCIEKVHRFLIKK